MLFDPDTDPEPFRRREPELPAEATQREREIAKKYTAISWCVRPSDEDPEQCDRGATHAWLQVGGQHFRVTPESMDSPEEASWSCWMLAKAIANILEAEAAPAGER